MPIMRRIPKTSAPVLRPGHNYPQLAARWALRLLVAGRAHRAFITSNGFLDDEVLHFIGLGQLAGPVAWDEEDPLSPSECLERLRQRAAAVEVRTLEPRGPLFKNLEAQSHTLGLDPDQCAILAFAVLLQEYAELATVWDLALAGSGALNGPDLLAVALGVRPKSRITAALNPRGRLLRSGLLQLEAGRFDSGSLHVLPGLAAALLRSGRGREDLFADFYRLAPAAACTLADFDYLGPEPEYLQRYLKTALRDRIPGCNVLLVGPAGIGKTTLARAVAAAVRGRLHEVADSDAQGDPLDTWERGNLYRGCQKLLQEKPRSLILCDGMAELLAPDSGADPEGTDSESEALGPAGLQHLLENNPVPTIWTAPTLRSVDRALRTRFGLVLTLEVPPRRVRQRLLATACTGLGVSGAWLKRAAASESTPGQIVRAARVVGMIDGGRGDLDVEALLEAQLGLDLRQPGPRTTPTRRAVDALLDYDLAVLNPDHDPEPLIAGIARSGCGSLLLYGPPGTGKTALAHHLAQQVGKPLLQRRASELVERWVGATEQNLARMFAQAKRRGAVLFLDEADSFLRGRELSRHSWEVTAVNELLQQMEDFEGVFVCATNFLQITDQAALRRFDVKLKLDYLTPPAREALLRAVAERLNLKRPNRLPAELRGRLGQLHNLSPGDYATLVRQSVRLGWQPGGLEDLLAALERESRIKPDGQRRPIGFLP